MERITLIQNLEIVFRKIFKNEALTLSETMTATDVDGWDSLSHMLLITDIENNFGIKFKLKELNKMRNVGDMINIILEKIELKGQKS